ncbi:hypothetical protein [Cellulomonas sp. URHD0024]|uniref:hypothetical protein n=1 Tax=Cellulomonas sp. URHD0024 TaxID=1302620 RepID=UPI0004180C26|nr:hypothetical protein [Cellulomonas sp. URHD0024]
MSDEIPDDFEIPDDLSSLLEGGAEEPSVALVLTPVAQAAPLAATCVIAKVEADVVLSEVGAIAVLREPGTSRGSAATVSQLLRQVPIVLLERREGQITASRWVGGAQQGDNLPPGLVLSDAPAVLEDLLLGSVEVGTLDGVVSTVGLSRWKALRMITGAGKPKK